MLRRVILKGFKSIKAMELELRPLNVLIGADGSGKSNLLSFFKMLNEIIGERLQQHIATSGRAHSLLHYGPKVTPQLEARLEFDVAEGSETYDLRLVYAANDTLVFGNETLTADQGLPEGTTRVFSLGEGTWQETLLRDWSDRPDLTALALRQLLESCRVYHFHDTSATARVREFSYIGNSAVLLPDGGNLAAFLYRLEYQDQGAVYKRIVKTIQLVAPFFHDFELKPEGPNAQEIILKWREKDSDQIFGPHQLSDGTLRTIFLLTVLLQPEADLPGLIIVDEPELGLHPYAINVIASLIKKASHHTQILVSTQSSSFLDYFEPSDVVVVDREGKESVFTRLDPSSLETWLAEYSLGEVWEKNVIGGGPHCLR